jgi:signal transduction histidine kinase/ligand-binding sensor domain-containing protein/DNA-binding response OmpR family regulator
LKKLISILFLFLLIIASECLVAQESNISFEHFSVAQGMTEPIVYSVIQDMEGYLWFGTWEGMEKFDGYQFTSYRHIPNNPNSISKVFVQTLYEDKEGIIWVGTYDGLEKFDKKTNSFTHYKPHKPGPKTELSNHVFSICEDKFGILWVGTNDGLNSFDKNSEKFISFRNDENDPESINNNNVNTILEDKAGSLWLGTGKGLDKLERKTGKFKHFLYDPYNKGEWDNYWINTIFEDKSGILWLGTRKGIIAFDQKAGTFIPYFKEINSVSSICEDEAGHLWIGTYLNGLYSYNKKTNKLVNYSYDEKNPGSLSSNFVTSICYERSGTIWITTHEGVNKLNILEKAFKHYRPGEITGILKGRNNKIWINTKNGLKKLDSQTGQIQTHFNLDKKVLLYQDTKSRLWFAKAGGGLILQDKLDKITKFYTTTGEEFKDFADIIYEAHDGSIWIGANGFFSLDFTTKKINKIKMPDAYLNCIYEDSYGLLWIGTFTRSLYSYNRKTDSIKSYLYIPGDTLSISGQTILDVCQDKNGILWVETNGGINKYNRSTDSFIHFIDKGTPAPFFSFTLLNDDSGNFWLNTRNGISKFNPATFSIKNYDSHDGLPGNGFMDWRGVKSDDGRMYFANKDELIGFNPNSIHDNNFIPPVVITSFKKFEKPNPFGKEIRLSYNENFISFEFSALSFIHPEKNQYAYKMESVDQDWVYSGTRRYVSYPNLDPGEYVFRVKGSNNDGVWNEEGASIAIIISPPWWRTWWAYSMYALLFVFSLYGIRRYEMNRLRLKDKIKLDEAVLKEKEETEKIKSAFFANISHEFRTPLTLILGPAEKIEKKQSTNTSKDAGIITRNSRRLLQLVNQLLDLSKLDVGKLKLEASPGNIISFVKGIALSFESLSESRDIMVKIKYDKEYLEIYFDKEKMVKVFSNLLSNAFKFTPTRGNVLISIVETLNNEVEINIRNIGVGIPDKELPKIFDRFYQVDSTQTKEYEGTGIGLALVKELIELHHGKITVDSEVGNSEKAGWTEFTIHLPLGREHLKDDEILSTKKQTDSKVILNPYEVVMKNLPEEENNIIYAADYSSSFDRLRTPHNDNEISEDKTIILVVEDNYDMREYIKESLSDTYSVEEAVNGEQGVRIAETIIPDLIISDLMMPKMDGNELTRILKNDERTSHIPIIILTAKSGQENKIVGLQTGADDYLTKPFDVQELRVRVENLINIRKKLQEKFSKGEFLFKRSDKKLKSINEKFLAKVIEVIEKHLSEEDFSIEECSSEVGLSRTHFHKKLRALVGKSPSQYVRTVRLYRAKQMIEEEKGNVSEVAYSVGFSSPAYFSRCFKEEFGYPPSDILT